MPRLPLLRACRSTAIVPAMFFNTRRIMWMMIVVSAVSLAVAGMFANRTRHFLARAVPATGTVVRLDRVTTKDHGDSYRPVFEYADAQGRMHTIYSSGSSSPPEYQVGDKIPVLYDPSDPSDARIRGLFWLWGVSLIFGFIGVGTLGMGIAAKFGLIRRA
jgi:hypothetical protein